MASKLKKLFIFDLYFEALPIAKMLEDEGVEVYVGIVQDMDDTRTKGEKPKKEKPEDKKKRLTLYDGMLKHKMTAQELVETIKRIGDPKDSFVLTAFNTCWKYAQMVSGLGIPGIYPTEEDRIMEVDREKAKEFIRKHYPKVEEIEEHEFKKVDDALKFLESSEDVWVVKGYAESAPTFVTDSDEPDVAKASIVQKLKDEQKEYEKGGFILEKKIQNVIEITPEMWFVNGKRVASNVDLENKRVNAGEIGFMTGCAADLVFPTDLDAPVNEIAFPPIVDTLAKKHASVMVWDLSLLFDPDTGKVYPGEFCACRPGYNAFLSELALRDDKAGFFEALMASRSPYEGRAGDFAASVRIFNFSPSNGLIRVPEGKVIDADEDTWRDLWLFDVKKERGEIVTVGTDYQVAVVTGVGSTIQDAANHCYKYVEGVRLDDKVYRPKEDYLSTKYASSIPNRYKYGKRMGLW